MLRGLDIRDMLIIDRLELEFEPGLNVLTGETGAGKSILLDSLGFVLGWRGRAELVRSGAEQGEVTAWFDLPQGHPAHNVLQDAGFEPSDELILRRVNTRDGRKTAWVNDRRASGEVLRALSDTLIELHGQHDDRGLLNARGHRGLLDSFGQVDLGPTRKSWRALSEARKALTAGQEAIQAAKDEEEFLRHAVDELDQLAPEPGEEATLDTQRRLMQAAERIRDDIGNARDALAGGDGQIVDGMRWLEGAMEQAEGGLDAPMAALERAMIELGEAQVGVDGFLDSLHFNPTDLDDAEERLFAIRAMARKHNVQADDLRRFAHDLRERLTRLDQGEADLITLKAAVAEAETRYAKAADALSAKRSKAAKALDTAMASELAPLKMERAVFATDVTLDTAGPDGQDQVAFTVATNPGAPSGPIGKIASGGELSRFLLALKVCLTRDVGGLTMIFDEIDRGVGGATADAVGRRLAGLADGGQVLVVTHSPQVAALGGHHWRVEKRQTADATLSTVVPLGADARVDEIARMLSGDTITDAARDAARALMNS
ncbi:DNA repair protein RecN [Thalassobium sp. R2A62]|uniref:DNA repair protein RecN n=1 Tax=Thalassobium sp. R2A62 TaxID=633131 RepID=UPI0001B1D60E|nr:DNA repair protein RecN [Thalassobium sp. R2A62]EET49224.1 DNA repair protein RecN [Thalassobium sp. R2A62]MDG1338957.1 DNA repair protein RecN [Paracoccaceae bacterium]MDG2453573.1 DNA repair protein RecN [Paracoccaceae bacterium]